MAQSPSAIPDTVPLLNRTPAELILAASIAELPEPVIITRAQLDAPGPEIVAVSHAVAELTGYDAGELLGRTPRLLQGPLTDRTTTARLRASCLRGERFVGETVNYRKNGTPYLLHWTIDPLRDAQGRITHFFSLQRDITARHPYAREWLAAETRARAAQAQAAQAMAGIAETILTLEETKRSFRSRALGQLRARLLAIAQAWRGGQAS